MENHYSNAEQDVLRQAFLPTSYIQIRRLPSRIRPGFTTSRKQYDEVRIHSEDAGRALNFSNTETKDHFRKILYHRPASSRDP